MDVHINEMQTNVRAVDGDSLLTPQTLQKIVKIVLAAIDEDKAHAERMDAEQRITGGVTKDIERFGR